MSTTFKGLIIGLLAIFIFYGLTYLAYRLAFGKGFVRKNFTKRQILIFIGAIFLLGIFVVYLISKNEYVYTWDSSGYWTWSYQHMNKLYTEPNVAMGNLWDSIINDDYNLIAPTIISLPLRVFGYTFNRFVIVNFMVSVIPILVIAICLAKKLWNKKCGKKGLISGKGFLVMLFAVIVFFVARLIPLFQGYIDLIIMVPILLLMAFAVDFNASEKPKRQWREMVMMGLLLVITFLLRRYTAFVIVGFFASIFIVSAIRLKRVTLKNFAINFLIFGGTALATVMVFFHGLVFRVLSEDYADLYSAYDGSLVEKIVSLVARFGLVFIMIAMIGIVISIKRKRGRQIVVVAALTILITVFLFFRVQRMDGHHVLTITPAVFVLFMMGLYELYMWRKQRVVVFLKGFVAVMLVVEPVYVYAEFVPRSCESVGQYVFGQKYRPLRRTDMAVLYSLRDYINATNPSNKTVYVLSSSVEFNWNTLSNLNKPDTEWAVNGQVMTHDVDLRDGFPTVFFDADIVVTANPIQLHLKEGSQEVIRYLAETIQDSTSYLKDNYKRDERTFELENGAEVYVYRKVKDLSEKDYDKIFEYFNNYYPDHYEIFGERIREY